MHGKRPKNKRAFTLFELMLVIGVVALLGGFGVTSISSALKEEQFEKTIVTVIDKLHLAQEIMIDYNCDVSVVFTQNSCKIFPSKPLPDSLLKTINRDDRLEEIDAIVYNGNVNGFTLDFLASDGITPKGTLVFRGRKKERTLQLVGYVSRITKKNEKKSLYPKTTYPQTSFSAA